MRDLIKSCFEKLVSQFGYPDFTTMDIHENFDDILVDIYDKININPLPETTLEYVLNEYINNAAYNNYIVCTMRFLTSLALQSKSDEYIHFITEPVTDMKMYCNRLVEALKVEADQIHIIALADVLKLSVTVAYIDLTAGNEPVFHHFGEDHKVMNMSHISLLYRPGHYDLLV